MEIEDQCHSLRKELLKLLLVVVVGLLGGKCDGGSATLVAFWRGPLLHTDGGAEIEFGIEFEIGSGPDTTGVSSSGSYWRVSSGLVALSMVVCCHAGIKI